MFTKPRLLAIIAAPLRALAAPGGVDQIPRPAERAAVDGAPDLHRPVSAPKSCATRANSSAAGHARR